MVRWRYIGNGPGSAEWNMAVDEALLRSFKKGDAPILRLYGWEVPSLSFGRFSRPEEVLHLERLQSLKIPYARRMTGGGILVHGSDISYTLIVPGAWVKEKGVKENYRYLCRFLLTLYRQAGLDADFAQQKKCTLEHTDVCLAGTEAYDIVIDGKKIGGNAQRHTRNALLQHGSVPLSIDAERFETLFKQETGFERSVTFEKLGIGMDAETLTESLKQAFCETYEAVLYDEPLRKDEYALAVKLFKDKYTKEAWNVHAEDNVLQT